MLNNEIGLTDSGFFFFSKPPVQKFNLQNLKIKLFAKALWFFFLYNGEFHVALKVFMFLL